MQQAAQRNAHQGCDGCQQDVFAEHVLGRFIGIEAQHLDGGDFPDPLCNVYIGQVVEHNEGQGTGAGNHQSHDVVETLHHGIDPVAEIAGDADCGNIAGIQEHRAVTVRIRNLSIFVFHLQNEGGIDLHRSPVFFIGFSGDIQIVIYIVITQGRNLNGHFVSVAIIDGKTVTGRNSQLFGHIAVDDTLACRRIGDRSVIVIQRNEA